MVKLIRLELPSALYRQQIKNIAARMHYLVAQTVLYPLRSMTAFNKVEKDFAEAEDGANLCCSVMDTAQSIDNEERASHATSVLMTELVHLKNEASDIVEDESNEALENSQL